MPFDSQAVIKASVGGAVNRTIAANDSPYCTVGAFLRCSRRIVRSGDNFDEAADGDFAFSSKQMSEAKIEPNRTETIRAVDSTDRG